MGPTNSDQWSPQVEYVCWRNPGGSFDTLKNAQNVKLLIISKNVTKHQKVYMKHSDPQKVYISAFLKWYQRNLLVWIHNHDGLVWSMRQPTGTYTHACVHITLWTSRWSLSTPLSGLSGETLRPFPQVSHERNLDRAGHARARVLVPAGAGNLPYKIFVCPAHPCGWVQRDPSGQELVLHS